MFLCVRNGELCLVGRRAISFEGDILHDANRLAFDFLMNEPQNVLNSRYIHEVADLNRIIHRSRSDVTYSEILQIASSPLQSPTVIEQSSLSGEPIVWRRNRDEYDDEEDIFEVIEEVSRVCSQVFPPLVCEKWFKFYPEGWVQGFQLPPAETS
jgi:hypothetical protein